MSLSSPGNATNMCNHYHKDIVDLFGAQSDMKFEEEIECLAAGDLGVNQRSAVG